MSNAYLVMEQSLSLQGKVELSGAKNAVLVIIASLLLTHGKSRLHNVPCSDDVLHMIKLLRQLGADVSLIHSCASLKWILHQSAVTKLIMKL